LTAIHCDGERSSREMCRSTGDGRAGGNIRATGLPSSGQRGGDGKVERAQQQEREGVCVWRPRNALCEEGRSYQICLVIGSRTSIACTLQVNNWNRCCGEYPMLSSPTDTPHHHGYRGQQVLGASAWPMSYVQDTLLCAREPLWTLDDFVGLYSQHGTPRSAGL
jgi:hypothetical protein